MGVKIIPSINCPFRDLQCVEHKARLASEFASMLHIDVADGVFTFHKSWSNPEAWKGLGIKLPFEVHLMTADPVEQARRWLEAGAVRIIPHIETLSDKYFAELLDLAGKFHAGLMLASNPETRLAAYEPYFGKVSQFLVLAVHPGFSGQSFLPRALEKIAALRARVPGVTIEVDGGINPSAAVAAVRAGADLLVSDTYIFNHPNPKGAYEALASLS
jgi:ribulose-phosphate 3-epimerase